MRGKVIRAMILTGLSRITPAYAGKRTGLNAAIRDIEDHPRVCGEKLLRRTDTVCILGSPPRMRGKGITLAGAFFDEGITPAYAGKSAAAGCCR